MLSFIIIIIIIVLLGLSLFLINFLFPDNITNIDNNISKPIIYKPILKEESLQNFAEFNIDNIITKEENMLTIPIKSTEDLILQLVIPKTTFNLSFNTNSDINELPLYIYKDNNYNIIININKTIINLKNINYNSIIDSLKFNTGHVNNIDFIKFFKLFNPNPVNNLQFVGKKIISATLKLPNFNYKCIKFNYKPDYKCSIIYKNKIYNSLINTMDKNDTINKIDRVNTVNIINEDVIFEGEITIYCSKNNYNLSKNPMSFYAAYLQLEFIKI